MEWRLLHRLTKLQHKYCKFHYKDCSKLSLYSKLFNYFDIDNCNKLYQPVLTIYIKAIHFSIEAINFYWSKNISCSMHIVKHPILLGTDV